MQDEFIPTGIRMNRKRDPSDARGMAGFLTRNILMWFFCKRCVFFWGVEGSLTRMSWENKKNVKEKGAATFVFVWKLVGFIYSCFLIGFYSRTSAYIIFFTWGWHKKSRNTTKKYQGIWGCCGETPIGAQPSLTWSCIFRKFLAGEGLSRNLAWTCYFASWNEHFQMISFQIYTPKINISKLKPWWALEDDFPKFQGWKNSQVPAVS